MNGEQRIVYVKAMILQAEIEMQDMIAQNQQDVMNGCDVTYGSKAFMELIEKHGIHNTSIITELTGC